MSRSHRAFVLFALAAAVAAPARAGEPAAWMRPKAAYVAHTVMESDDGRLTGRVWASGDKERRELQVAGRAHHVILRRDRGVSWVLMPEQRMYLEQSLDAEDRMSGGQLEREALGRESVNGVEATKYRVHGTGGDGRPFEATMWMTDDEIPVRVLTGKGRDRVRIELERLSVGFVDPQRFELPPGYARFELPGPAKADLDALRRRFGGSR